ncbi:MAG TPA: surface lipoprotein assembly modifier [Allosphingosinicella sp.]|nr:surface lipoprotein assembly modifier [Allosphingosinicella sp.]
MRCRAALSGAWLLLAANAQPGAPAQVNDRDTAGGGEQIQAPSTEPPEPGEQYPASLAEGERTTTPEGARQRAARRGGPDWRLTVDASVVADSNVTNSTDAKSVDLSLGGVVLPVPLDPSLREHGGVGVGMSASLRGRVPLAPGVAAAIDAEGFVLEQQGGRADDASALIAAGVEVQAQGGATFLLQATGFDRRYAGVSAMRGAGLRARYRQPLGEGEALSLFVDARFFDSDYGEDFGGTEAGLYLTYETVIDPTLSGSAGVYVRASWLGADAYSSREIGIHGGLSHYLTADLIGGITAGLGRVEYEGPILLLSPDARADWRAYGSLYVATRRPFLVGLTPSLTYTYNRTSSSIEFFRADRHRLRFGLSRSF